MRANHVETRPYRTKDGTLIRELMHPAVHGNCNQSLAEAVVAPGQASALHRHGQSEALYHIAAGTGEMTLGEVRFSVGLGDTVCTPPGTPHCICNTGDEPLRILCACSPAYSHDDTEML